MAVTPQQKLDALETAILKFYENGAVQSYTTPEGLTVSRANIEVLERQADRLRAQVSNATSGSAVNRFRRASE